MDFGTLKSRILALIGRAPSDLCYDLVTADINQMERLRVMEATTTLAEAATVSLPDDFLQLITIYRDVNPRTTLKALPPQPLQDIYEESGIPAFYSLEDGQLRLSPSPSGSENIVLRYYAKLSDLDASDSTNVILSKYPSIYVYGTLTHHAMLVRDQESLAMWSAAYDKARAQARSDDNRYRAGATSAMPVARATA